MPRLRSLGASQLLQQLYDRISGTRKGPKWGGAAADHAQCSSQMVAAFEGAHEALRSFQVDEVSGEGPAHKSGACGVAVLLRQGEAIAAWTGDCRAVLGALDEAGVLGAIELSTDHKLEQVIALD